MVSLFVLVISFILLRGLGWLGVERLSSWRDAGRFALVIMFLFTGFSHFSSMKYDLAAMIPAPLPNGLWRSEEHTSELQSRQYLVCRLLLEKKKKTNNNKDH